MINKGDFINDDLRVPLFNFNFKHLEAYLDLDMSGVITCDDLRKEKLVKFLIDAKISKCCLFEKQSTQRPFFVA